MWVITKKQILSVIALLLFCCVVGLGAYSVKLAVDSQSAAAKAMTVVLDAGHGGVDGGVVGFSGSKESDINLAVTKKLKTELEDAGYRVVLTRTDENGLYGNTMNGFKKRDMAARRDIIIKNAPLMVISIHMNRYSDRSRRGAQVFYDDAGKGKHAADIMQSVMNSYVNKPQTGKNYESIGGDFYITKCSKYVSLIVECGFLSNKEDEAQLLDESYQKSMAHYIRLGLDGYVAEIMKLF